MKGVRYHSFPIAYVIKRRDKKKMAHMPVKSFYEIEGRMCCFCVSRKVDYATASGSGVLFFKITFGMEKHKLNIFLWYSGMQITGKE